MNNNKDFSFETNPPSTARQELTTTAESEIFAFVRGDSSVETKEQQTRRQEMDRFLSSTFSDKEYIERLIDSAKKRNLDTDVNGIYTKYLLYKKTKIELDDLQALRKSIAREISGPPTPSIIEKVVRLKNDIQKKNAEVISKVEDAYSTALTIPNVLMQDVPIGNETRNRILRAEGNKPQFDFTPRDHVEIGELLDIIDIERATKVSGTRFGYLKNEGVLLEFALVQLAMKNLVSKSFTPIIPPALIKQEITQGLGYWQGEGNENYYLVSDFELEGPEKGQPLPLYLVGTGEHSVVPMHKDEVINEKDLPKKYVAFSPCFRREAGSYGKDVRGILRVHQFDKVEMVAFVRPGDDEMERRKLLELSEGLMQALELPYQVVQLASGDLGFPSAETIDIETWIPSQSQYRETHSISTTTDFQARRLNIRYEDIEKASARSTTKPEKSREEVAEVLTPVRKYVHILNGTAFAIGRTIIAILENFQEEDGSVKIPEVLQKYTGFSEIKPR